MTSIEYSARNFSFLIVIILSGGAGIYCSVKCVFAVLLTVCTVEQYVVEENLFAYAVLACFKARISRICRTARKLKACGHNILDSLIAVFTVYNVSVGINVRFFGKLCCRLVSLRSVHTRCEHQAAVDIVTAVCTRSVDRKGIVSYKKRIRNRCSRRVNHYRICKLNYIIIIFICSFGSLIADKVTVINRITVYSRSHCSELCVGSGNNRIRLGAHKFKRYAYISAEMVEVNRTVCAEQYLFPSAVGLLKIQVGSFSRVSGL